MNLAIKQQRRVERSSNFRGLAPLYQIYIAVTKIKQKEEEIKVPPTYEAEMASEYVECGGHGNADKTRGTSNKFEHCERRLSFVELNIRGGKGDD
ncbi:unnamed protein product [Lathyrus sativus]|nr:unnamed protein product [Lathyrus sativus]